MNNLQDLLEEIAPLITVEFAERAASCLSAGKLQLKLQKQVSLAAKRST